MHHHLFTSSEQDTYRVAILQRQNAFLKSDMIKAYVDPLNNLGIPPVDIVAFTLAYNEANKAPVGYIKDYLDGLLKALEHLQVTHLYVTDSAYFKVLAGKTKADPHQGYVLPCKIKGYEHMSVVLGINHRLLFYNPELQQRLDLSLKTLAESLQGNYKPIGQDILHTYSYPSDKEIASTLKSLHQYPRLACDIEAFSLRFNEAGIGTIAFAWDKHNGVAFAIDHSIAGRSKNISARKHLRDFFETYQGELIFHNAAYDVKVLIYELWMNNLKDTQGLLRGLHLMTQCMHDTKVIAYLATNTTAGNQLGLKHLAHEFAGNWAVEVNDITKVPTDDLLQYNLVDALCTNFVYDKYVPIMEADKQGDLYRGLFLDSLKLIIQLELTGMPMSDYRIQKVREELEQQQLKHWNTLQDSPLINALNLLLQETAMETANAKLKKKQHPLEKFKDMIFNPNSGPQMQRLLYEVMGLPVLDKTDSGAPATGADTLEKLLNHAVDPMHKEIIEALVGYGGVTKILSTFIPAFEAGIIKDSSDSIWLHGSFNLGGTVSGRLSSSDPNLQNLPANSQYGDLVKTCFTAPDGWLFCGADYNSLEDYISALTTKDPNKLKVYEEGYDGHCLRAAYYFPTELAHIILNDPNSVNSIKVTHPELRQKSKVPTFALTYAGTYHTLMANLGWSEEEAKTVERNYHELYKVSDEYVHSRLEQASKDGYVEVAFGLRVRTPLLKQVIWKGSKMPYEAAAEGRTAGNALGQSYGLLNNRAAVAFFKKVWASKYKHDILPVALIHDAIYILVKDDVEVVEWANKHLIKEMRWQELPEIQHPTVKLGASLDIFWPDWSNPVTLPNDTDQETILKLCSAVKEKFLEHS